MEVLIMFGKKIAKLIDVKSIVTIALVVVLCYMTITGQTTSQLFESSVMLVLGFFFGRNANKPSEDIKQEGAIKNDQS